MGTPAYMSPEQKTSMNAITAASDIYSLGVVMYELFVGSKPIGDGRPPSHVDPKVPPALSQLIMSCLEPDPAKRPLSADTVKDRLLELLQGAHIRETQKKEALRGVAKMEDTFTLLDVIKEHRYGAVFLLRHKLQDRLMVVKRFNIPLGGFRDAQLLTTLKHENIVNIYGVSGVENNYVIVMEYLSGGSLSDRLLKTYSWIEALKIMKPVCQGLGFAHRNRIIHGNLRPSNILFSTTGKVKISDFGLNEHYARDPDKTNWFNTANQPRSKQTDIFATGAILYKMLTGTIPELKEHDIVPHRAFQQLPREVQHLVANMLIQNPALRFQNFDQIASAMDALLNSQPQEPTLVLTSGKMPSDSERSGRRIFRWKRLRPLQTGLLLLLLLTVAGLYLLLNRENNGILAEVHGIWIKISALLPRR